MMHAVTCLGWPEAARLSNHARRMLSWLRSCLREGRDLLVRAPVLLAPWLFIFTTAAHCQAAMDSASFAGKQIKLLIGFSPTGYGYDTYGRLLARHLGKYLPGDPLIIPQNRPGAGSLNLANYLYNAAPKDGSEIAIVGRGVAMEPLRLDQIRLARQHEQRGVGPFCPTRSPDETPLGGPSGMLVQDQPRC